jgi:hypothetical protein
MASVTTSSVPRHTLPPIPALESTNWPSKSDIPIPTLVISLVLVIVVFTCGGTIFGAPNKRVYQRDIADALEPVNPGKRKQTTQQTTQQTIPPNPPPKQPEPPIAPRKDTVPATSAGVLNWYSQHTPRNDIVPAASGVSNDSYSQRPRRPQPATAHKHMSDDQTASWTDTTTAVDPAAQLEAGLMAPESTPLRDRTLRDRTPQTTLNRVSMATMTTESDGDFVFSRNAPQHLELGSDYEGSHVHTLIRDRRISGDGY